MPDDRPAGPARVGVQGVDAVKLVGVKFSLVCGMSTTSCPPKSMPGYRRGGVLIPIGEKAEASLPLPPFKFHAAPSRRQGHEYAEVPRPSVVPRTGQIKEEAPRPPLTKPWGLQGFHQKQ